ncbi:MAG TPA: exopolysaccharide biosynthesis protein [Kofleriaceae bacterium]|nr:exopolysaccharide biosynthesis protein [Kofleriaceae bacterium]
MDAQQARDTIATEAPRRLRLDELLRELGAMDEIDPAAPHPRPEGRSVGELVDKAAEAGFGFLVGLLALIAIPFFGLSTPFGLAIALLGAQMMLGRTHPWLPNRARRRQLSMPMLDRVLVILARRTRWLARSTRRRWEPLIRPRLIGLAIVVLALALALPLPIPGSNLVFLVPIFIYAVGLLERDGMWIVIGHVCLVIDLALLFAFGTTVLLVLQKLWHWMF